MSTELIIVISLLIIGLLSVYHVLLKFFGSRKKHWWAVSKRGLGLLILISVSALLGAMVMGLLLAKQLSFLVPLT